MDFCYLRSFAFSGLLLCLSVLSTASADIILDFKGNHPVDGSVKAELRLKDSYKFGEELSAHNMIELNFNSGKDQFTIKPQEITNLFAGFNSDGSLLYESGNYQFYMDAINNKFFGTRTDGTWRARDNMIEGNLGKWSLRIEDFDKVCLRDNNLHKAAARGDVTYVQKCLDAGVPVDIQEGNGWTPLHSAARNGRIKVARLLIKNGADKTITENTGRTARDLAVIAKQFDMIAVLDSQ